MKTSNLNIIVKKLSKLKWKMITCEKLKHFLQQILDTEYNDKKAYKMIYHLKTKWYIISLKKDLFFVKDQEATISEQELLDAFYRKSLKEHCTTYLSGKRYIGGVKALELNVSNYEIPEEISVVNAQKQATEIAILSKKILFKKYQAQQGSFFNQLMKLTRTLKIWTLRFPVANLELSILESLYSPNELTENYINELIKKLIKKYHKMINLTIFGQLIRQGKYHSSINRLYKLSRIVEPSFAEKILEIIKKYSFLVEVK